MASWLCSKEGAGLETIDGAVEWLCSKEGAGWKVERVASWFCCEVGVDVLRERFFSGALGADEAVNWLYSGEANWEAERVANWLYSSTGADWEAKRVANWLCSEEGAGWEAERVAEWLYSAEQGADWEAMTIEQIRSYRFYESKDKPYQGDSLAKHVASWLCSVPSHMSHAAYGGTSWEVDEAANWLYSSEGADLDAESVASWLCSKKGAGREAGADKAAKWLFSSEGADQNESQSFQDSDGRLFYFDKCGLRSPLYILTFPHVINADCTHIRWVAPHIEEGKVLTFSTCGKVKSVEFFMPHRGAGTHLQYNLQDNSVFCTTFKMPHPKNGTIEFARRLSLHDV